MNGLENREGKSNVVVLRPVNEGRFAHTIYQEDLLELLLYSNQINEARDRYRAKREYIRAALASGAAVEPGALTALLQECQGGGYQVAPFTYRKLVVR